MSPRSKTGRLWLALGGLLVALLAAGVFTLGSLNLPIEPQSRNEIAILFPLSVFIVAALLVFGLILVRSLLRLWAERRAGQIGSRFKTKMVLGALAISLLPVLFMFLFSYGLMNRTLSKWFPRPLEIATERSESLLEEWVAAEQARLKSIADRAVLAEGNHPRNGTAAAATRAIAEGADAAWQLSLPMARDRAVGGFATRDDPRSETRNRTGVPMKTPPRFVSFLPSRRSSSAGRPEIWEADGVTYLTAFSSVAPGTFLAGRRIGSDFLRGWRQIETQQFFYARQKAQLKTYRTWTLVALGLFTVLLLFSTTWVALFLSKQVTVPIQALAEGTREISRGNFDYCVAAQAQDELGILVSSFNQMTAQLGQSRRQIDEFTRNLQLAVEELERRRRILEAVAENIPTGVLSLDESGSISRSNQAVSRIFGERARGARTLAELVGEEAAAGIERLMRRSLRMGAASKELAIALPERVLHAAVTVSSLGPRRANPGFVVVIDDLTELLRAQKSAAWQEVAQRIAHEIKNPLTPIQLSAERLVRHLERAPEGADGEWRALVSECAALTEREAALLKSLVDEFSQFARFPAARPVPADLNAILSSAVEVFGGRLEGVAVEVELARSLPQVRADPELLRRVIINLIDNAAEAMEGSAVKELRIATRLDPDGETVEIAVADSGHGISPEDKDKLFLPRFSTKGRGTGLGLAIVGRIIAEHHGTIRVEDNRPTGARFLIRLPVAEVPAAPGSSARQA